MNEEVLNYIGLDLNNIDEKLKVKEKISFSSYNNGKLYKVYKHLNVDEIDIFITPLDRVSDLKERLKSAIPLEEYLNTNNYDVRKIFLETLEKASTEKIKKLEELQEKLNENIPYFVSYDENYLWQIYYSEENKKYFMLFPANEGETSVLFYIIKKKLEKKSSKIFVPINKMGYSEKLISAKELGDIENYIWLFTNEWPNIYEVDEENIYITGHTKIESDFESKYRIIFRNGEDIKKYYMFLKVLFIIETESNYKYEFSPYITENGELGIKYKNETITIKNLTSFIDEQTNLQNARKVNIEKEIKENEKILEELKEYIKKQSDIYKMQEKQIVTFLECKNSFFGKIRFFIKNKKFTTPKINIKIDEEKEIEEPKLSSEGSSYTVKELINSILEVEEIDSKSRNIKADIRALKLKKENLNRKIKNAEEYIKEIEKHKKSIFEFWKFANKDKLMALNIGEETEENVSKIKERFDLEQDMEYLGEKADSLQRRKLSNEEIDAVFCSKYLLELYNGEKENNLIQEKLEDLKKLNIEKDENILKNLLADYSSYKSINNKTHRESCKNIYKILKISEETTLEEFKDIIKRYKKLFDEAFIKIKAVINMPVYVENDAVEGEYVLAKINTKDISKEQKEEKIYKINVIEDETNILYFSNIILYDNYNKTLPIGMNIDKNVLIKMPSKEKMQISKIHILDEQDMFTCVVKEINLYEIK